MIILSTNRFCHSSRSYCENKRKGQDRQILASCQKNEKAVEPENHSDNNCRLKITLKLQWKITS